MSQNLLNCYANFLNGRSWGDALMEEEASNEVVLESVVTVDVVEPEIVKQDNFITNKWMDTDSIAKLRDSFVDTYQNTVVESIVVDEKQDYSHPTVINYIKADQTCSDLWQKYMTAREKTHNESQEITVKVTSLDDVVKSMKNWVVASEDRFAAKKSVERDVPNFDFEKCFQDHFPKETSKTHCADMVEVYNTVIRYRLKNHEKALRNLKLKLPKQ